MSRDDRPNEWLAQAGRIHDAHVKRLKDRIDKAEVRVAELEQENEALSKALEIEMARRHKLLNALTGIDGIPMFSPAEEIEIATKARVNLSLTCLVCGKPRAASDSHQCYPGIVLATDTFESPKCPMCQTELHRHTFDARPMPQEFGWKCAKCEVIIDD